MIQLSVLMLVQTGTILNIKQFIVTIEISISQATDYFITSNWKHFSAIKTYSYFQ